jgi:PAS domain S-box-containing protein
VRDISERVNAESALREYRDQLEIRVRKRTEELHRVNNVLARERERLAITLRSIGDGVISCDLGCRIVFMNGAAERLTGWSAEEAFGRSVAEVLHLFDRSDRSRLVDPVHTALQAGEITELAAPVVLRKRSGEERLIDDSAAPIRNLDGTISGVVVAFRDVTEKDRLEEELFKAKRMESVAVLAGGIAHDFNNLLTGINNQMFMSKVAARGNTDVVAIVNEAQRELLRAQKLAVQLLTFAQGGEPVMEVGSPKSLIEGSVGFFMSGSRSTYDLTFGDHLMNIKMDKGMIEQVISNLVINAEQAMPEGGTVFIVAENTMVNEAHIDPVKKFPVPLPAGVYVRITVSDTGPGIPDEIRDRVFDPFFSTRGKGRGLGLAIVQSVMIKHGGAVVIDPASGGGASFLLYLPAVEVSAPDQIDLPRAQFETLERSGGERILLMDDEPVIRQTTGKILELLGYRVVTAGNGDEAVSHFAKAEEERDPFDTVILDLTVPGAMGGRECIARLRTINPHVRAIVSSGYSIDAVMADYTLYGFKGVLRKPYTAERLDECLRDVLG